MIARSPKHFTRSLLLGIVCALAPVAACDDGGEQRKQDGKAAPDGKAGPDTAGAAVPGELPKFKNPAEAISAYNRCYSDCFGAKTSATNRETCKLDCDALAETGVDTLKTDAEKTTYKNTWQTLRGCVTACFEDKSLNATNRQTCLLTCSDAAEVSAIPPPTPPAGTPPATGTPPAGTPPATGTPPAGTPPTKSAPGTTTPPTGTPPGKAAPTTRTPPPT